MRGCRQVKKQKATAGVKLRLLLLCWRRPIFPGRLQPSIVGTDELNFRVRNGNGWILTVINTNFVVADFAKSRHLASSMARSLRRSSSPTRTHFIGLRVGLGRGYELRGLRCSL